jgi:YfiH family protein
VKLFLTSKLLADAGVLHGFSLREGGDDRARLRDAAGLQADIATVHQVHGDRVIDARGREVLAPTQEQPEGADALVALADEAVGVRVADCVPVLLYDTATGAAAAVHSGWRGTRLQIAARGVRALQKAAGTDPATVIAAVGPSIGRCCYKVSRELAGEFRALFGTEAAEDPAQNDNPRLDLRYCVTRALLQAGVRAAAIEHVPGCTSCDSGAFFSFRRDKGAAGRHLAFIASKE